MDYGIGIGCALFFAVLSTLILRSVAEYGIASAQTADENSAAKEEDSGKAGDNRIHEQILPAEYIKYLVMVCITGIVVSVFFDLVLSAGSSLCGAYGGHCICIVGLQLV